MKDYRCISPKENTEFLAAMEDILDIYELTYNTESSFMCMKNLPMPERNTGTASISPGDNDKIDSEYVSEGTCSISILQSP